MENHQTLLGRTRESDKYRKKTPQVGDTKDPKDSSDKRNGGTKGEL